MKTIVAVGLMALFIFVLVVEWRAYHPSAISASTSASQIIIHGTPVCVFRHGESIVARVGECEVDDAPPGRAPGDRFLEFDGPESGLPPGHPPVGPDSFPEGGGRRVLI